MMLKLINWIQRFPERWVAFYNAEVQRRLGNEDLGLPWSVRLHGDRNSNFLTFKSLHRFFVMLAHLHALHRSGKHGQAYAQVCQYLKVVEQVVLDKGQWDLAWTWTGLEDPEAPMALKKAPVHPVEYSASIGVLREMKTLIEFPSTLAKGGGGGSSSSSSSSSSSAAPKGSKWGTVDHP